MIYKTCLDFKICTVIVSIILLSKRAQASDLFTGTDGLRTFSSLENVLVPNLNNAISTLEDRINLLKLILSDLKYTHRDPSLDELLLAGHPVHAYNLIKRWQHIQDLFLVERLTERQKKYKINKVTVKIGCKDLIDECEEWAKKGECRKNPLYMLENCQLSCLVCKLPPKNQMDQSLYDISEMVSRKFRVSLPEKSDFEGAAMGLIRLQRTYNLKTQDIAAGSINGFQSQSGLERSDYYNLGKSAVQVGEWSLALQWLELALEYDTNKANLFHIRDLIAKVYIDIQEYDKANETIIETAEMFGVDMSKWKRKACIDKHTACPRWAEAKECTNNPVFMKFQCPFSCNLCDLESEVFPGENELINTYFKLMQKKNDKQEELDMNLDNGLIRNPTHDWQSVYEGLCRGDIKNVRPTAVCRYRSALIGWNVYKEEILSMNPRISMVYDVISDKESDMIIRKAKSVMTPATVGTERVQSGVRVSKVGWLYDDNDKSLEKIAERVERITGLELTLTQHHNGSRYISSEPFQTVNYGIGGHYEPHTDYFDNADGKLFKSDIGKIIQTSGDRIATFLIYLTNVAAGGSTVYPEAKVQVAPVKNAAAFWFNARKSGMYDPLTLHAGCPVLLGEKWVSNKWIREFGNEFKRKCGLNKNAKYV